MSGYSRGYYGLQSNPVFTEPNYNNQGGTLERTRPEYQPTPSQSGTGSRARQVQRREVDTESLVSGSRSAYSKNSRTSQISRGSRNFAPVLKDEIKRAAPIPSS